MNAALEIVIEAGDIERHYSPNLFWYASYFIFLCGVTHWSPQPNGDRDFRAVSEPFLN